MTHPDEIILDVEHWEEYQSIGKTKMAARLRRIAAGEILEPLPWVCWYRRGNRHRLVRCRAARDLWPWLILEANDAGRIRLDVEYFARMLFFRTKEVIEGVNCLIDLGVVKSVQTQDLERRSEAAPKRYRNDTETVSEPFLPTRQDKTVQDRTTYSCADAHTFDDFWKAWPESRRVRKKQAAAEWAKLQPDADTFGAIQAAIGHLNGEPRYIAHPHRWLRGRRWEDAQSDAKPGAVVVTAADRKHGQAAQVAIAKARERDD